MKDEKKSLADIMCSVLDLPLGTSVETIQRSSIPGWDSLRHVKLMLNLQKEFGVKFSVTEMLTLDSYNAILAALQHK